MQDLIARVGPMIPALRRYVRSLVRDPDIADDLVQDCLERVIAQWNTRREDGDARPWVFAIAHNVALDELRRLNRRGIHVAIEDVQESEMIAPGEPGSLLYRDLLRALEALPEEQRSVLLLVSVEDFSYADAARTLGIPLGTVMSRLSRGRERLQRLLDQAATPARTAPHERSLTRLK